MTAPPSDSISPTAQGPGFAEIVDLLKSMGAVSEPVNVSELATRDFPKQPISTELSLSASFRASNSDAERFSLDGEEQSDESLSSNPPIDEDRLKSRMQSLLPAFNSLDFRHAPGLEPMMRDQDVPQLSRMSDGPDRERDDEDLSDMSAVAQRSDPGAILTNYSNGFLVRSEASDNPERVSSTSVSTGAPDASSYPARASAFEKSAQRLPVNLSEVQTDAGARQSQRVNMAENPSSEKAQHREYSKDKEEKRLLVKTLAKSVEIPLRNTSINSAEGSQLSNHDMGRQAFAASRRELDSVMSDMKMDMNISALPGAFDSRSCDEMAPSTRMHVTEIATHFPVLIANNLPASDNMAPGMPMESMREDTYGLTVGSSPIPLGGDRVRILRFKISPAELGEVLVKMRIHDSRVEIEIEAQTVATTNALSDARDALSTAIEHRGMILNAFDITTQNNSNALPAVYSERHSDEGNQAGNLGQGGAFNGDRPQQRQRETGNSSKNPRESGDYAPVREPNHAILL